MKPFVMTVNHAGTGTVDFSYLLDAPAGKHGFVQVREGHFFLERGNRIRFFGVNLVFGAAMPEREMASAIAERLAKAGINMVRLHHVDSYQAGENSNTIIDYSGGDSQKLHAANMDRLDYLIAQLKERGIYIHIDLFTLRKYLPGDQLDYDDELRGALKHVNYYNRRLIDLHKKQAELYLTHRNPYTGLRYVDDSAVAVVQVLNENGIFWDNGDSEIGSYTRELDVRWNEWLLKKYGGRSELDAAWTKHDGTKGLSSEEAPENGSVRRPEVGFWGEKKLDHRADYTSVDGPARFADHAAFLTEIQLSYHEEMSAFLRGIGVKCPINASNLPSGAAELRCNAAGDVMENNAYWNHPISGFKVPADFHQKTMVSADPTNIHVPAFAMNLVTKLSIARVEGKPFVVTEWNACWPTRFRADVMLMLSSYAAFQDWDGLLLFSFSHSGNKEYLTGDKMDGLFDSFNDPALFGQAGLASAIFQGHLVKEAEKLVEVGYSELDVHQTHHNAYLPFGSAPFLSRVGARFLEEDRYEGKADVAVSSGFTSTGDYSGAKHAIVYARSPYQDAYQKSLGKLTFLSCHQKADSSLPLRGPGGQIIGTLDESMAVVEQEEILDQDFRAFPSLLSDSMKHWGLLREDRGYFPEEGRLISDTGELDFRYGEEAFMIRGEQVISYVGPAPKDLQLDGFGLEFSNPRGAVSFLSRDGKSLKETRSLLVVAVGESVNEGMKWEGDRLVDDGTGPVLIDPLRGKLQLPSNASACNVYVLDAAGRRISELQTKPSDGGFTVFLSDKEDASIYYEFEFIF